MRLFTFSQFERLKVQDRRVSTVGLWRELSSQLADSCPLAVSHMAERKGDSKPSGASSYKDTNAEARTPPSPDPRPRLRIP